MRAGGLRALVWQVLATESLHLLHAHESCGAPLHAHIRYGPYRRIASKSKIADICRDVFLYMLTRMYAYAYSCIVFPIAGDWRRMPFVCVL